MPRDTTAVQTDSDLHIINITRVVGQLVIDPDARPIHEAAFAMIAAEDTPGTYEFPMAGGLTCRVTYEYVVPAGLFPEPPL